MMIETLLKRPYIHFRKDFLASLCACSDHDGFPAHVCCTVGFRRVSSTLGSCAGHVHSGFLQLLSTYTCRSHLQKYHHGSRWRGTSKSFICVLLTAMLYFHSALTLLACQRVNILQSLFKSTSNFLRERFSMELHFLLAN